MKADQPSKEIDKIQHNTANDTIEQRRPIQRAGFPKIFPNRKTMQSAAKNATTVERKPPCSHTPFLFVPTICLFLSDYVSGLLRKPLLLLHHVADGQPIQALGFLHHRVAQRDGLH